MTDITLAADWRLAAWPPGGAARERPGGHTRDAQGPHKEPHHARKPGAGSEGAYERRL
jgi:hypothetical protein